MSIIAARLNRINHLPAPWPASGHASCVPLQGEAYGLSPFFRISFATSMQTLEEGCHRLRLACEALR